MLAFSLDKCFSEPTPGPTQKSYTRDLTTAFIKKYCGNVLKNRHSHMNAHVSMICRISLPQQAASEQLKCEETKKLFPDVVDLFLPIPHVQNTVDQT